MVPRHITEITFKWCHICCSGAKAVLNQGSPRHRLPVLRVCCFTSWCLGIGTHGWSHSYRVRNNANFGPLLLSFRMDHICAGAHGFGGAVRVSAGPSLPRGCWSNIVGGGCWALPSVCDWRDGFPRSSPGGIQPLEAPPYHATKRWRRTSIQEYFIGAPGSRDPTGTGATWFLRGGRGFVRFTATTHFHLSVPFSPYQSLSPSSF